MHGLLLHLFEDHKPHARTLHRLADPLGIRRIVLVGYDIRLDKLWRYPLDLVAIRFENSTPVVCTVAGIYRYKSGRLAK